MPNEPERIFTDNTKRTWKRTGYCCRCGECCVNDPFGGNSAFCPLFAWIDNDGQKQGGCNGYGKHSYYLSACASWPSEPEHIADKPSCTYTFTEVTDGG